MTSDIDKRPPSIDKLTRIPIRHVWFHDSITFAGLDSRYSTISNVSCVKSGNENRYVTCSFVPAWQVFEFQFHTMHEGKDAVRVRRVSAARISQWEGEEP
jgi:hypothetical protein